MADLTVVTEDAPIAEAKTRIVEAAAELIAAGGRNAATTRAVAVAAGVQAPTIYRLFGDKQGLLDAVAEHGLAAYVAGKAALEPNSDPVQDLRGGWDMHVEFGLSHPGLFAIMAGDWQEKPRSPSVATGKSVLRNRIRRVALAGRLVLSEERTMALLVAACNGTVTALLGKPEHERDAGLSATAREAIITAITGESSLPASASPRAAAIALNAALRDIAVLTSGEKHLLEELLTRIANDA